MREITKELYSTKLSDEDFENLCTQILSKRYGCVFQRFGRKGQRQHGIDAFANQGFYAQYKNYRTINSSKVFIKRIYDDYSEARKYFEDMQKFVVVTHLNRDTSIQQKIKKLNCCIEILFWEDIENECCFLKEKNTMPILSAILDVLSSLHENNINNKGIVFCDLFSDVEKELNEIDGYMVSIEAMEKILNLCKLIRQRNMSFTFQYQPQLRQCYNDLIEIVKFFDSSGFYQNRNPDFFIIDNSKIDINKQNEIKSDFLKLKKSFYCHAREFHESIAGKSFSDDSDYD